MTKLYFEDGNAHGRIFNFLYDVND